MISAFEALRLLSEGNERFVSGSQRNAVATTGESRRAEVESFQEPFAIVLGCSDSRVPTERVFDQGLGDLFVVRVAGNIAAPSQIGSIEFGVAQFGTELVVVLGHSNCGAVQATLMDVPPLKENPSPNIRSILDRIRPSIESSLATNPGIDTDVLLEEAVRANIRASVKQLCEGSELLQQRVQDGRLLIVGAEYSLKTGLVYFFDQMDLGA